MSVDSIIRNVPLIVRYRQSSGGTINLCEFSRSTLAFLSKGEKFIYYGDKRIGISPGEVIYFEKGTYYVEDVPDEHNEFEQILIHFEPEQFCEYLNILTSNFGTDIDASHICQNCNTELVVEQAAPGVLAFFSSLNGYFDEGVIGGDKPAGIIMVTELLYFIFREKDSCVRSKLLRDVSFDKNDFRKIIYDNIFNNITIEELARQCKISVSSFKKEFRTQFKKPPHKWFLQQRLEYSRFMLITTNKGIMQISNECNFSNSSHYIKLFKTEYGITPSAYRVRNKNKHSIALQ